MSYWSWRDYVAKMPQCNFMATRNPLTVAFTHPGLTFRSFDRDNNIGIISLMMYVVDVRVFGALQPIDDDGNKWFNNSESTKDYLSFVSSTEFTISRAMYDRTVDKWPLDVKMYLGHIGNSTLVLPLELYVPGSSEPLLIQMNQIVTVDKTTRRPKPFPEWFKDKYKNQCKLSKGFRLDTFPRPSQTFVYKRQVMWLDTDMNNHTNYAAYVRYAIDGLHEALRLQGQGQHAVTSHTGIDSLVTGDGSPPSTITLGPTNDVKVASARNALKGITKDIIREGISKLKICYVNECVEGDLVDVHIWQEEGDSFSVRSSLEQGSSVLCQIILEYFSPLSKL